MTLPRSELIKLKKRVEPPLALMHSRNLPFSELFPLIELNCASMTCLGMLSHVSSTTAFAGHFWHSKNPTPKTKCSLSNSNLGIVLASPSLKKVVWLAMPAQGFIGIIDSYKLQS